MTVTTNDLGRVALGDNEYQSCVLQFPGEDTYVAGTMMARKDVSDTISVAYTRAGSSTFTAAATSQKRKTLKAGAYTATAGTLTSGVGRWTITDPDGNVAVFDTLANTDDLYVPEWGLKIAVTDPGSGTAFETGDVITCTVSADGDVVIYDPDGTGGAQTPVGVLPDQYAATGAEDQACNMIRFGKVNKNRLVIDDDTTVSDVHVNLLAQAGLYAIDQDDVSMTDNAT